MHGNSKVFRSVIYCLVATIFLDGMKCEGETAEDEAERREDIVRLFSAMRALIGGESLVWGARLYRYCECRGCCRKRHPRPDKAHIRKIKKCGLAFLCSGNDAVKMCVLRKWQKQREYSMKVGYKRCRVPAGASDAGL